MANQKTSLAFPLSSEREGEATNRRPRGQFRQKPGVTQIPSFSLSLEGEGWGEGGCLSPQPCRGPSNPPRSTRLFSFQSGACLAYLPVVSERPGESTNRRPRGRIRQQPKATPCSSFSLSLEGEGWGEGGCISAQPCRGSGNPQPLQMPERSASGLSGRRVRVRLQVWGAAISWPQVR